MRILWFTNIPLLEDIKKDWYVKGSWLFALSEALAESGAVKLAVVSVVPGARRFKQESGNVTHYIIPDLEKLSTFRDFNKDIISACKDAVDDFCPDVVHIHGTERFYGLLSARGHIKCPTVISIQGLIHVYSRYYYGGMSPGEILLSHSLLDWLRTDGLIDKRIKWSRRARQEIEIIRNNRFFIGRTLWDKANVLALNQGAKYHHCDELLRPEFYKQSWDVAKMKRHSIFVPTGHYPLKGLHLVLRSAAILKRRFPDLLIRVCDSPLQYYRRGNSWFNYGYAEFLRGLIRKFGLDDHLVNLGIIGAEDMALELLNANVFVLASLIENSCNSLQEAMLVGTPSVVSCTGGTLSLVRDNQDALFYPAADANMLAERVENVFLDDNLACGLSASARESAARRNNKQAVTQKMLEIYKEIYRQGGR